MSILLDRATWGIVRYLVEPGMAIGAVDDRDVGRDVREDRCPQPSGKLGHSRAFGCTDPWDLKHRRVNATPQKLVFWDISN